MTETSEDRWKRRIDFARRYEPRTIAATETETWKAGEDAVAGVEGWLMTLLTSPGAQSKLQGQLAVRYPWKGAGGKKFGKFWVASGGLVWIPWPWVELRVSAPAGATSSTVTASFWPIFVGERPPAGASSDLFWAESKSVGAGASVSFDAPEGATDFRAMPAEKSAGTFEVTVKGSTQDWAFWILDGAASSAPGLDVGAGGWREVPPAPSISLSVKNTDVAARVFTVSWRSSLGSLR